MKILFLCNIAPPVSTGAHQRIRHLVEGVASAGEVTLVYPIEDGHPSDDLQALSTLCKQVYTFPEESLTAQRDLRHSPFIYWLKHKVRYLHPFRSALMQSRWSADANALVGQLCSQEFDLIWCERISCIQMLPADLSARVIVDLDDLEHRSLRGQLRLGNIHHMTPLYWLEFFKLRKLERSLRSLPYEFSVCSEGDRKVLGEGAPIWIIPNGTDVPLRASSEDQGYQESKLIFIGNMAYGPNIDAVLFFTRSILPLIREEIPDIEFLIVGRDPTRAILELHDGKSVIVTGTVPEVEGYLRHSAALVVPIRFGGGTRIKILEAMAHRKPVVSTVAGAEGLDVQSGKHLLIADSPKEFAKACILLLKDSLLQKRLSDEGYQLVRDRYQWEQIERTVIGIVLGPSEKPLMMAKRLVDA